MICRSFPILVLLAVLACRREPPPPEPVIEGTVINNFGQPVVGAAITIRDTAFHTTTNARGEFSIHYVPGSFQLRIDAPRHAPYAHTLQVTQAVRYPLGTKMLPRIPEEPPSAALVVTTEGYRPLERETLARTRTRGWSQGRMQNCLEYRLQGAVPTLRAADLMTVFPLGGFQLTRVEGGVVTRDDAPDTIAPCPGLAAPVQAQAIGLGDRQFLVRPTLSSGVYCFISSQRYNPLFNTTGDLHAWCFEWQQDPSVRWGAVLTLPADVDDHASDILEE